MMQEHGQPGNSSQSYSQSQSQSLPGSQPQSHSYSQSQTQSQPDSYSQSQATGTAQSASEQPWPWWTKWAQKALCVFSGLVCAILGVVCCLTIHGLCIVAGILQVLLGCLVLMLEAPCCCAYLEFIDTISKFSDGRPHWQKAVIYCVLPIVPIAICPGATTIIGNILVFLSGLTFAYLALGRKASRQEMLMVARRDGSGLVDNAQPMSFTDPPQSSKFSGVV